MKIAEAHEGLTQKLATIYDSREAATIAQYIFEDVFFCANPQSTHRFLLEPQQKLLKAIEMRLMRYEPWQYITSEADFYGLKFAVNKDVLIPRPETEGLVAWVVADYKKKAAAQQLKALDIGTGSGCIAITVAKKMPQLEMHALEYSAKALQIAQQNAQKHQQKITFWQQDILDETTWKALPVYDIIISNPPYIQPTEKVDMIEQVKKFEPEMALFTTNNDPLQFYRAIANFAQQGHLKPQGQLYFELSEFYAKEVETLLSDKGFKNIALQKDLQGKYRMIRAQWPAN